MKRVALFIDAENVLGWLKKGGLRMLLEELGELGPVSIRRAYGRWSNGSLAARQAQLNQMGFELENTFHPVKKKNSADMHMTVDVMECAMRDAGIHWVVLVTGDSDFGPLFRKLREMGKEVIGVGPRSPLSECVKTSCSRFIYTEDQNDGSQASRRAIPADALDLLQRSLQASDGQASLSSLKNGMLKLDGGFSQKTFGFKRFKDFLEATGMIELCFERGAWQASLCSSDTQRAREENTGQANGEDRVSNGEQ